MKAREIKRRLKGVENIQEITRAMEMVAASRIKRAQDLLMGARPVVRGIIRLSQNVLKEMTEETTLHPLLQVHEEDNKICFLILSSDKGLCGSYNYNILRTVENLTTEEINQSKEVSYIVMGQKGVNYFTHKNWQPLVSYKKLPVKASYRLSYDVTQEITKLYAEKKIGRLWMIYNTFKTVVSQTCVVDKILPLSQMELEGIKLEEGQREEYIYEPEKIEFFNFLLPIYLQIFIYSAMIESTASEHAARMTAMRAATDNAGDVIKDLTRMFNKARQASITGELTEIVSGAEALK